jgi:hypothetical protein
MSILAIVVMDRYEKTVYEARSVALKMELSSIRQSIKLFKIIKGRYPSDLKELITSKYISPYKDDLISGRYLEPNSVDNEMNILDPFDIPYGYDPKTGEVHTKKKGFERL